TFQWSNTSTDSVAINLPFGTYSVTVTDTKGCSQDTSMTVYQYDALNVQVAVIQNVSCFGLSDAKASITATGGHPMYTYSWPDGVNTSQSHDALSVGTYVITVTDANGCFSTKSFTVTEPTPISIAMLSDLTSCYNSADGKAYANIQGGLAPYNYNWSNNTQLDTLTAMRGTYSVTVSDVNGCTISASIDINAPDSISSTAIIDNVICNGGSTGSITISTTGGVGNYEYLWSNNTIDATNNNLAVGEYFVTILDANNCFVKDSFIITEPAAWNISANTQNLICFGNNIGAIDISVTGNTAPYSYQWSSTLGYTSTSDDIFNLQADMYTITVTDDNSCTTTASYTISQPDELLVQYTSTDVRCKGGDDGSIAIEVVGGTPGYNFHWVGPNSFDSNSEDISALLAGDYHLTISDQNACEHIQNITLSQPSDGIYTTTTPIDNICFGATNGQLQSSPQGGTPPYHFMWSNNATTALINNLAAGIYFVTITDGGDCAFKDTAYVFEQPQLSFTLEPIASTCNNGSDGKCNILDVKIGNTPQPLSDFQFQWSTNPVQTGAVATQLNAGQVYNVTVTNDLGCTESKEFTVPNPDAISYEILRIQQSNCHDSNDGEVEIQGLGGTSPYTYLWDQGANSATTSSVVGLKPGRYNVSIADNNRCYTIAEINITAPAELVSNFEIEHVKCKGNKDAFAQVNVSGGVPNYSYIWSNGNTSSHNDKLLAGTYSVTIVDANGCTQIDSVAIVEPSTLPSATVLSENVSCYGASDGRITIQAIGGVYPYTYSTDGVNFNGLSSVLGLTAGVYTLFVKDHNGCLIELEPREILQPLPLLLDLGEDITISQESSITLEPTISNALSQITYGWSTTDSTTISCLTCPNPVVSPLFPQQYSLEITDANGCKDEDVIWIKIYKNLNVFVATGFTPNGDNENDQLFVQGKSEVKVNSFMVFDRWGENVFSSENATINDNTKGWDGNYRGKPCPPGLYLWKADVEFIDGTKLLFKGETSLIR
ncbi:MAG: gliding motility-associated C-terminal domain-containing protein, partial [Saprospiraceae bacterium]|nr:gliding motility-associated C-terminal domain-containing protein [Saprospiraceae bacterium]